MQDADVSALEQRITQVEQEIANAQGLVNDINKNTADIAILKSDDQDHRTRLTNLENQQNTHTSSIQANTQNITVHEQRITTIESDYISTKGNRDFIDGYVPQNDQSPATKKTVDTLEATLRSDFNALSGYETA